MNASTSIATPTSGANGNNDGGGEHADAALVWRFGYGSNIALSTLRNKKNLNPRRHVVGTIRGWSLTFSQGIPHVEPGFATIRPMDEDGDGMLHGSAFLIPKEEADGLDRQERAYRVLPCRFEAYDGEIIERVGLYAPKKDFSGEDKPKVGTPSRRYLGLLQQGAREAGLAKEWIEKLDSFEYYTTPGEVRSKTIQWIQEFHADPDRRDEVWTVDELMKHDGSDEKHPAHVAVMQYVVNVNEVSWVFGSWKGHCVTRRNLLHLNGQSVDKWDIRPNEDGFRPLPKVSDCSDEEKEYLLQNLETLLHRGGIIVARLKECIDDDGEIKFS